MIDLNIVVMPSGTVFSSFSAMAMVKESTSVANFSIIYVTMILAEGSYMTADVPTARKMSVVVFLVMMLHVLVGGYQHSGGT